MSDARLAREQILAYEVGGIEVALVYPNGELDVRTEAYMQLAETEGLTYAEALRRLSDLVHRGIPLPGERACDVPTK